MRLSSFLTLLLILGFIKLNAQNKFKPYKAYGIEVSLAYTNMTDKDGISNAPDFGPDLSTKTKFLFDVKANYDYAPLKFIGLSTGAGLSVRGGKGGGFSGFPPASPELNIFYFNIPVKLQLKAGFFWIEPGLQTNILIAKSEGSSSFEFDRKDLKPINLSYSLIGRFNLSKGISLHLGYERALTPVARVESQFQQVGHTYYQISWLIGFRYMINEPNKSKR